MTSALAVGLALSPLGQGATAAAANRAGPAAVDTPAAAVPQPTANLSLAWAIPNYPVGRQLRWLLNAVTEPPVPAAQLKAHFDARFLSAVPPAAFNRTLSELHLRAPVRITSLDADLTTTVLLANIASGGARLGVAVSVDTHGLMDGLQLSVVPPFPSAPTSWAALDAQVRSLAPGVSFEVATISPPSLTPTASTTTGTGTATSTVLVGSSSSSTTSTSTASTSTASTSTTGSTRTSAAAAASPSASSTTSTTSPVAPGPLGACHVVNAIAPGTARPLGSMFKLYVLATVANEVRSGRLSWGREVALTNSLRSLPSGLLQIEPAGARFTVSRLAQLMISGSDNTAADRLAALVGRSSLEAQVATTSAHARLDQPFLRTRELFVLKYGNYPRYVRAYLALPVAKRTAYLNNVVDRVPLSDLDLTAAAGGAPRYISSVEWFASPADICGVYSQLYGDASSPSLAPVSTALSYNDGGVGLARSTWPVVWFKGGSEQGVLTLAYLARRSDGTVAVVVLQLSDPSRAIAGNVTLKALADVDAAFKLVP